MKLGTMLQDIFGSLFRRTVTRRYPTERTPIPERLRGKLVFDQQACNGCSLCAKDCPANAIEIVMMDKETKRFAMRYRVDRCTFCAQCVVSCPQGALSLTGSEWELANTQKDSFALTYGEVSDGESTMGSRAQADADHAEDR